MPTPRKIAPDPAFSAPPGNQPALEETILRLLAQRGPGRTICPSEAAKAFASSHMEDWKNLMEPVRIAARSLVAQRRIHITQHGHPIDPATAKGPIRLRLR